jgi:hypothetical protein
MSLQPERLLFWTPRILGTLFVLFMSVFAMDVFEENKSLGQIAVALIRHLVPAFICLAVLLVAWRWERIGAVLYVASLLSPTSPSPGHWSSSGFCSICTAADSR